MNVVAAFAHVLNQRIDLALVARLALDIGELGFEPTSMEDFTWACSQPYGMVLVTGPTGSGKSTTLYSGVSHISEPEINIVTVEDPVEYTLAGVNLSYPTQEAERMMLSLQAIPRAVSQNR